MKNNSDLQKDVQDAIKWEPLLHAAEIGVTAKDGIVTLTGTVDNYSKKKEAENAAKSVMGARVVVEKIEVKFNDAMGDKDDNDIALDILRALKANHKTATDNILVAVEDGWLTLEGNVLWNYQRLAAENAVKDLQGVKGVSNNISIRSNAQESVQKLDIERALRRNWAINDDDITVQVAGSKVILVGSVKSWYQKDEAEKIAWNAPGVWTVDNSLVVEHDYELVNE